MGLELAHTTCSASMSWDVPPVAPSRPGWEYSHQRSREAPRTRAFCLESWLTSMAASSLHPTGTIRDLHMGAKASRPKMYFVSRNARAHPMQPCHPQIFSGMSPCPLNDEVWMAPGRSARADGKAGPQLSHRASRSLPFPKHPQGKWEPAHSLAFPVSSLSSTPPPLSVSVTCQ